MKMAGFYSNLLVLSMFFSFLFLSSGVSARELGKKNDESFVSQILTTLFGVGGDQVDAEKNEVESVNLLEDDITVPSACAVDQDVLDAFSILQGYVHTCRDLMLGDPSLVNFYSTKTCLRDIGEKFKSIPDQGCKDTMLTGAPGGMADVFDLVLNGYLENVVITGEPGSEVFHWDNAYDADDDGEKDPSDPNFIPYVQHYFSLIGEWYTQTRGEVYKNPEETKVMSLAQADFLESQITKKFWDRLQETAQEWRETFGEIPAALKAQQISDFKQTEKLFQIFETMLTINRKILNAAHSSELAAKVFAWKDNETAPGPAPVLAVIIGETLAPFYERVRTLTKIYDVACKLNSCNDSFYENNETVWMLNFFQQVGQGEFIEEMIFNEGDIRPLSLFIQTLYRHRVSIKETLDKVNEVFGVDNIETMYTTEEFPFFLQPFHRVFAESYDLVKNYEATKETRLDGTVKGGFFHGGNVSQINVGFGKVNMNQHIGAVKTVNEQMEILSQSFVVQHNQLINQTLSVNASIVTLNELKDQIEIDMNDIISLNGRIDAIREHVNRQNERFDETVAHIIENLGSSTETFTKEGGTVTIDMEASSASAGSGTFSDIGRTQVTMPVPVLKGDMLRMTVEGEYQPSCAVAANFGGDATGARVGPRGYNLVYAEGESHVESTSNYRNAEAYVGTSLSFSVPIIPTLSFSASAGARATVGTRHDDIDSNSTRSDASFDLGLILPGTPFPNMPAGALLLVEMPLGENNKFKYRSIQTLDRSKAVIAEHAGTDSEYFLVVNDCFSQANNGKLVVNIDQYRSAGVLAQAFIDKVVEGMPKIEESVRGLIDNGVLSQRDLAVLRGVLVGDQTGGLDLSQFTGNIRILLEAFVDAQIAILDSKSQITNMERDLEVKNQRLASLLHRYEDETAQKYLKVSQRNWNLANMDLDFVNTEGTNRNLYTLNRIIAILEHNLVSYLDFKYDEDRKRAIIGNIRLLAKLNFSSPFDDIALNITTFMRALLDSLQDDLNNRPVTPNMTMGLHIPNPYYVPPAGFPAPTYDFPVMDSFRAKKLWDQIYAWKRGKNGAAIHFEVKYEDLYNVGGMACYVEAPIIESTGMYFIPENEGYITDFNNLYRHRNAKMFLDGLSYIPFENNPRQYNFTNDDWRFMDSAVRMAKSARDGINQLATEFPPNGNIETGLSSGRSPFGYFQIGDIPAYKYDSPGNVVSLGETPLDEVKELFVAYTFAASNNDFNVNLNWLDSYCGEEGTYWKWLASKGLQPGEDQYLTRIAQ